MDLMGFARLGKKTIVANSPGILTGLGAAGLVTTAVLTGKAAIHADRMVRAEYYVQGGDETELMTKKEVVALVWKEFVPPVVVGVASIACIIGANSIGTRRAAAFAAAFKLSEDAAEKYRQQVVEKIGAKAEEGVREKLAEQKILNTPGHEQIIVVGSKSIFFDEFSGRYFEADFEAVRKAVNDINYQINNSMYASVSDLYDKLGLKPTEVSGMFGWNANQQLDVLYVPIMIEEGKVAISLQYRKDPIHGYDRLA